MSEAPTSSRRALDLLRLIEDLQRENAGLQGKNAELRRLSEDQRSQIEALARDLEAREREVERLKFRLNMLARQLFGRKADKVDPAQLRFAFPDLQPEVEPLPHADEAADEEGDDSKKRRRRRNGRVRLPDDLPRERREHLPPEAELTCEHCGCAKQAFTEEVSESLEYIPASFKIIEDVRIKFSCPLCRMGVSCADLPPRPIEKGRPGPGLLAEVIVRKYGDHLPLNRQVVVFARQGVRIPKSTLADWVRDLANLLEPIAREILSQVLESPFVQTDETGVRVRNKSTPGNMQKGRIWVYGGIPGAVYYAYTPTKEGRWAAEILAEYEGFLQADAASTFDQLYRSGRIVEVGCWAHSRRKFVDAMGSSSREASWAIATIKRLFRIEQEATDNGVTPAERLAIRQEKSKPLVDAYFDWLESLQLTMRPSSPLATAVNYAINQKEALRRFLEDGHLKLDNNRAELALRQVAVGRKNWLFAGSPDGGRRAAVLYTLVGSCKELGIDPAEYLRDVIERVNTTPLSRIRELTPIGWNARRKAHEAQPSAPPPEGQKPDT